ncbi:phage portal protein [Paludibacter sp. 221]|uniref:phage portal protein n=1 Tax=Paludibacter sp. 221 TaxID=2302939 RepID=UPI0013D27B5A|nr:phage portal protein [Paludibacter sp. 221]NDV46248.1 phage portal protein [Paludibacter sp. 221]
MSWIKDILSTDREWKRGSKELTDLFLDRMSSENYFINCGTMSGRDLAYKKCGLVSSVIGRCAESIANLNVWALDEDGKVIKTKEAQNILNELKHPNPKENFSTFSMKLETFLKKEGKAYVRRVKSNFFNESDYYVVPNNLITPVYSDSYDLYFNRKIDYWELNNGTTTKRINPEDIFVFYDRRISKNDNHVLGGSRLESLSEVISTLTVLWEVSTELYGDGGAKNIISLGADDVNLFTSPFMKQERETVQSVLKQYGFRRKQYKNLVTKAKAEVHPLTSSIKELGLTDTIRNGIIELCSQYVMPVVLLGIEASRYKATTEARQEFYNQSVVPSAKFIIDDYLSMIGKNKISFRIEPDCSHMDFYQASKQQQGVALQQVAQACSIGLQSGFISKEQAEILVDSII